MKLQFDQGDIKSILDLVEPLAHPDRFEGNAEEGRDVIIISLPGYGFSDPPAQR